MNRLSRRELLAWMAAGTATTAAGWTVLSGSGGGSLQVPPGTGSGTAGREGTPAASGPASTAGGESSVGRVAAASTAASPAAASGERLLVVVEMPGGNDGLSMVAPFGLAGYYDARPGLGIPAADLIRIDDEIGLHPRLERVAARGVAVVQGVGSTEPDGSHFEMMRRWWRGDPGQTPEGPGWVGRLADVVDAGSVATAMTIGTGSHPILRSEKASTLAIPGADAAWYLAGGDEGVEAAFQRGVRAIGSGGGDGYRGRLVDMSARTIALADELVGAADDEDGAEYPDSGLGRSLGFASGLFQLGAGIRVVHIVMEGDFDTHESHADRHAELMGTFDEAVDAFWNDLDDRGLSDRVLLMTTSEFGRTLRENGSAGLDHGTASSALVMGPVSPGRYGEHPSLTSLDDNGELIATVGLDAYLAGAVEGWLGVPATEVFDTRPEPLSIPLIV